jgi:hypothetical protein
MQNSSEVFKSNLIIASVYYQQNKSEKGAPAGKRDVGKSKKKNFPRQPFISYTLVIIKIRFEYLT